MIAYSVSLVISVEVVCDTVVVHGGGGGGGSKECWWEYKRVMIEVLPCWCTVVIVCSRGDVTVVVEVVMRCMVLIEL